MSKSSPITEKELDAIKQSVEHARLKLKQKYCGYERAWRLLPRKGKAIDETRLLRLYRYVEGRTWFPFDSPDVKQIIKEALVRNDLAFFVKFGRVLGRKPMILLEYRLLPHLECFLIPHWAESKDGLPALFYLTPDALTKVCNAALGLRCLTRDAVVKTCQRLGLKGFPRQKHYALDCGDKWQFPLVKREARYREPSVFSALESRYSLA